MGFRSANLTAHMIKFNSAVSSDFLDMYNTLVETELINDRSSRGHKTFAPSQMRCDRVSWFRLRGTEPDKVSKPDIGLNFTAQIGTACHQTIQKRLVDRLGNDWISVQSWINDNPELFMDYDMSIQTKEGSYESEIDMHSPYPVRFACDGIIRFQGKIYLLEIKTAEYSSLNDLTEPKPKHLDQIKCYSTLLKIPNVLFLYQDRQYGDLKCFEVTVDCMEQQAIRDKMDRVIAAVESNIAPEGLPIGDPDCSSSMCKYYQKCAEWGR